MNEVTAGIPATLMQAVSTVLLGVTAYFLKGVADIQRDHGKRLNNHAQRLAMLDKSTDDN